MTICTDVKVPESYDAYRLQPYKTEELRTFLHELNFKAFEKTLFGTESAPDPNLIKKPTAMPFLAETKVEPVPTLVVSRSDQE